MGSALRYDEVEGVLFFILFGILLYSCTGNMAFGRTPSQDIRHEYNYRKTFATGGRGGRRCAPRPDTRAARVCCRLPARAALRHAVPFVCLCFSLSASCVDHIHPSAVRRSIEAMPIARPCSFQRRSQVLVLVFVPARFFVHGQTWFGRSWQRRANMAVAASNVRRLPAA